MGRILRVEIVVLSASTAIVSVRGRDLQNLDPHGLNKAKQAGAITAGGLDPDPLDLTEGSHPSEHLSVTLPSRGKALAPQHTVVFIDDGRYVQILVGVYATNDMLLCWVSDVHSEPPWCDRVSTAPPDRVRGQDSHVTRWSGPSRVTGIGEAKPHRRAFPGGRRVQGKTRLVDRECGSGHTETPCGASLPSGRSVLESDR